jgi:CheY-specific phosphatase CheX
MFEVYFGQYLKEKNVLSDEALESAKAAMKSVRIKMGFLAVEAGYMSKDQATKLNRLQAQVDKRFGDLAVEHGYLTEDQVTELLKKQGNPYLQFLQTLTENNGLDLDKLNTLLDEYAADNDFDGEDVEALKSGDIDRICHVMLRKLSVADAFKEYIGIVLRTLLRFIDRDVRIDRPKCVSVYQAAAVARQDITGEISVMTAFAGAAKGMLALASQYASEEFTEIDADSLDSVCEFLNVCNGLFVTAHEENGIELELCVPQIYPEDESTSCVTIKAGELIAIPLFVFGQQIDLLVAYADQEMEVLSV